DDDQSGQSLEQAGLIPSDAAMSGPGNTARLSMPFEIEANHAEDGGTPPLLDGSEALHVEADETRSE
ncbi:MAG: hypothetical protein ACRC1H_08540, partial [Caldilineaceae bacterium]